MVADIDTHMDVCIRTYR